MGLLLQVVRKPDEAAVTGRARATGVELHASNCRLNAVF